MSHSAQHDFLTSLPNRVLLNDRLTQAISFAQRQGKQLAVLFVDLDDFKKKHAGRRELGAISACELCPWRSMFRP